MARKQRGGPKRADAKQRVKTARGRSNSSTRWLQRQLNDPYVQEAKRVGYRSRAAFKLIDIDDKYRLIRRKMRVVDLGAAPGGWCQVAAERIGPEGRIVAVDLLEFGGLRGVDALVGDFHEAETQEAVRARLGGHVDLVLSDMGASTIGHAATDHLRSAALAEAAFEFATEVLADDGAMVVKLLQGAEEGAYVARLRERFAKVDRMKPPASRDRSSEMYIVARGFRDAADA
ncbi:MAG: RlmE family RNA methyltransferase [Pseudomonadota bacterium]|nr:RlmE family RNA methyltransferase [Pseudomonadota bacterium]